MDQNDTDAPTIRFTLGEVVITPAAQAVCPPDRVVELLQRHLRGDWGCLSADDREANTAAVDAGERLLSAYPIDPARPSKGHGANTLWVITEADRSVTTILLPQDY